MESLVVVLLLLASVCGLELGFGVRERARVDVFRKTVFVDVRHRVPLAGHVTGVDFHAKQPAQSAIELGVWQKTESGNCTFILKNKLKTIQKNDVVAGVNSFTLSPGPRTEVAAGDYLGVFMKQWGAIDYDTVADDNYCIDGRITGLPRVGSEIDLKMSSRGTRNREYAISWHLTPTCDCGLFGAMCGTEQLACQELAFYINNVLVFVNANCIRMVDCVPMCNSAPGTYMCVTCYPTSCPAGDTEDTEDGTADYTGNTDDTADDDDA